jgi:hypothetical protein
MRQRIITPRCDGFSGDAKQLRHPRVTMSAARNELPPARPRQDSGQGCREVGVPKQAQRSPRADDPAANPQQVPGVSATGGRIRDDSVRARDGVRTG